MLLLLDTNVIIFWLNADSRISKKLIDIILDTRHTCYVSAASIWELEIKVSLGKLQAPKNYVTEIQRQSFVELPINFVHAQAVRDLPKYHKDPFDRLLISQAIIEKLTVITFDANYRKYPVQVLDF